VEGGKMRFVLLKQIGHAVVQSDVPPDLLRKTLEACADD
jgi:3-dehydroquinate synthase